MGSQVVPTGGDKNNGPAREVVTGLFLSIAFVLVSLRFYVRAWMVKKLWWDDFFLLLGLLFSIAVFGLAIAGINSGFGRHIYYLSPEQILFGSKMETILIPVYAFSLMFTKISICLFLLRIFMTKRIRYNRVWKRAMHVIMALIVATSLSSAIVVFPRCKPVAKLWNPTIKGTCWPVETERAIYYYQGGVSIFTDFLLAFLPIYFLKDIQVSIRTKFSICALMSLGVFTGVCAVNRTALTARLFSTDITYASTNVNIWAGLEMNVATIAAAIPALRPLWAKSNIQNQNKNVQICRPANKQHLNSTYVMVGQQREADSLPSRIETRIAAQGSQDQGHSERKSTSLPDCNGIMKTSGDSKEKIGKCEGNCIPEHSSVSDRDRRIEDVV